ncbi:unnamed protein product [Zymoseptoria tritici ST99CH_3D7]|uniref:Uncharacterized protein n=1 Tax=Zymoseptoria tritici (strain ST99CH_3D7) TaxID=1276538 RepID=A0A1X7REE7_ZYMT9|nr:unnamed protein product [Zymoseptoria tritici ST99CH_3D7]
MLGEEAQPCTLLPTTEPGQPPSLTTPIAQRSASSPPRLAPNRNSGPLLVDGYADLLHRPTKVTVRDTNPEFSLPRSSNLTFCVSHAHLWLFRIAIHSRRHCSLPRRPFDLLPSHVATLAAIPYTASVNCTSAPSGRLPSAQWALQTF